jgi:glucosyl-3-phosphoglycerate synthase
VRPDEWFRSHSFCHRDFSDFARLYQLKHQRGIEVTLILPTLNVVETIGSILDRVAALDRSNHRIYDQVIVVDSDSTDGTMAAVRRRGVEVYAESSLMPEFGRVHGKGDAMWRALSKARGDIIVFADTDTKNFRSDFVASIVGCLLMRPELSFVKAAYRRPFEAKEVSISDAGGRVTELLAKPLINMFYPELAGFVQPLAGEFGSTRDVLYSIPFFTGYAVEIGILIDVLGKYGLASMAQVDLDVRLNRHQDLAALSRMAYSILRAVLMRAIQPTPPSLLEQTGLAKAFNDVSTYIHAVAGTNGLTIEQYDEILLERPPMRSVLRIR